LLIVTIVAAALAAGLVMFLFCLNELVKGIVNGIDNMSVLLTLKERKNSAKYFIVKFCTDAYIAVCKNSNMNGSDLTFMTYDTRKISNWNQSVLSKT